jgi:hypothetical protein
MVSSNHSVQAVNIGRFEKAPLRRGLVRSAIRGASREKKQGKQQD